MTTAEHMADLTAQVLNHFADELKDVGAARLAHEAERAETLPRSPVGDAMRLIVDTELTRRRRDLLALHLHIGHCASPRGCTGTTSSDLLCAELILGQRGWDEVAARMDRWEKAGYDGGLFDAEYDSPSPAGVPGENGDQWCCTACKTVAEQANPLAQDSGSRPSAGEL